MKRLLKTALCAVLCLSLSLPVLSGCGSDPAPVSSEPEESSFLLPEPSSEPEPVSSEPEP